MKAPTKINALASMIKELHEGATTVELENVSGLHVHTIWRWIRVLRAQKIVYVQGWERDARGCNIVRVYKLGDGRDAKRPKPMTSSQKNIAYRRRKKLRQIQAALTGGVA